MHDLHTTLYRLDDIESAARRDILQSRRHDRSRTFGELAADLVSLVAHAFSPLARPVLTQSGETDR